MICSRPPMANTVSSTSACCDRSPLVALYIFSPLVTIIIMIIIFSPLVSRPAFLQSDFITKQPTNQLTEPTCHPGPRRSWLASWPTWAPAVYLDSRAEARIVIVASPSTPLNELEQPSVGRSPSASSLLFPRRADSLAWILGGGARV